MQSGSGPWPARGPLPTGGWAGQSGPGPPPAGEAGKAPRRRKTPFPFRSLLCLLQALEGRRVLVELRSDLCVRGLLDSVDHDMK